MNFIYFYLSCPLRCNLYEGSVNPYDYGFMSPHELYSITGYPVGICETLRGARGLRTRKAAMIVQHSVGAGDVATDRSCKTAIIVIAVY